MKNMLETLRSYAEAGKYRRVPVSRELYADAFTPVEVMRTLRAASRHCYLLESAEDKQRWGRYSFLGYDPSMEVVCRDCPPLQEGWWDIFLMIISVMESLFCRIIVGEKPTSETWI